MQATAEVLTPRDAASVVAPATGVLMTPAYARTVGAMAYIWGWPMANQMNRRAGLGAAPGPLLGAGIIPGLLAVGVAYWVVRSRRGRAVR